MHDSNFALSVVIPVYNGAATLPALVAALAQLDVPGGLEIILVNDASPDHSLQVCHELCHTSGVALTVINLSRNYGEHNAVMAGLAQARGAHVITMDDDLQNPPEEVVRLWQYTLNSGHDVVYTYYLEKQHASWRNLGSRFTNWCADIVLDKPKGLYLSTFRCLNAFTAKAVATHTGPFPYVDGLILQVTQNIGKFEAHHLPRLTGESNYTVARLVRLFMSMLLNFSVTPLRIATLTGTVMAVGGIIGMFAVLIEAYISGTPIGWASLMASIFLLAGVQLLMLGVIGEYLGRMFLTINRKPQFTVRDIQRNSLAKKPDSGSA